MMKFKFLLFSLVIFTDAFGQFQNKITQSEKIFGLSKIWQEVNYNFANFDNVPTLNWDSAYVAFIPKVTSTQNDLEYYKMLMRFSALLKDAHTSIFYPKSIDTCMYTSMFGDYRISLQNINNKAIVWRINKSKKDIIPIGSEVIEINHQLIKDYLKNEIIPIISASSDDVVMDWAIRVLFWGLKNQLYNIKIKRPTGEIIKLSLIHQKTKEKELFPPENNKIFDFVWMEDKIIYIALNSFANPIIDSLFISKLPELHKAKGLIIDVRKNGGGSSDYGAAIAQYLSQDSVIYASKITVRANYARYKYQGSNLTSKDTINDNEAAMAYNCFHNKFMESAGIDSWKIKLPIGDRLIIPTVALMGHNTSSAAEEFLLFLDKSKQIVRFGQHSNGNNGQPYFIDLPGGGGMTINTQHCSYPDDRKYNGCGVKPDFEVKETVEDIVNSKDVEVLEAVKYLETKLK